TGSATQDTSRRRAIHLLPRSGPKSHSAHFPSSHKLKTPWYTRARFGGLHAGRIHAERSRGWTLLSVKRKITPQVAKRIDSTLEAIIDQWYLSVSDYYITIERRSENPGLTETEELKRFHDETGHRIKFNKGELDFTYGLCLQSGEEGHLLEVSVNNKAPHFNYEELVRR